MSYFRRLRDYGIPSDRRTYVIAEIGINHGGDIDLARRLIDSAAGTGCDAVKFQTYITEKRAKRDSSIFDILKKCELPFSAFAGLKAHAEQHPGMTFFSTPFDSESAEVLREIDCRLYKIASFDVVNHGLLRTVAGTGAAVIMSVGMADLTEVAAAYDSLRQGTKNIALMHCVSAYPTQQKDAALGAIFALKEKFDAVIGQSDHTDGIEVPLMAVAAGAQVLEKHYRISADMECVDAPVSISEEQMSEMVRRVREAEEIFGAAEVRLTDAEKGALQYRRLSA